MISIQSMELRNFLGYGDYVTVIKFTDYPGATLIVGEKEGEPDKACATGKTSIIEAIVWCIFGSTTLVKKPGDSIINWNVGHSCYVKIKTIDGYCITRTRKLNGNDELIVEKDGVDMTRSTAVPMQELINSTFKINYDTSVSSIIFGQHCKSFLELSDIARRKVIERLFKISNISGRAATANTKIAVVSKEIMLLEERVRKVDSDIASLDRSIITLKESESKFGQTKIDRIAKIKEWLFAQKEQLDIRIKQVDQQIIADTDRLMKQVPVDVAAVNAEWSAFTAMIGPIDEKILAHDKTIRESDVSLSVLMSNVTQMTSRVAQLTAASNNFGSYPSVSDVSQMWSDYETKIAVVEDSKSNVAGTVNKMSGEAALLRDKKARLDHFRNVKAQCSECDQIVTNEHRTATESKLTSEIKLIEDRLLEHTALMTSMNKKIADLAKLAVKPQYSIDFITAKTNERAAIGKELSELVGKLDHSKSDLVTQNAKLEANKSTLAKVKALRQSKVPKMTIAEATAINNASDEIKKTIQSHQDKIVDLRQQFKNHAVKATSDISNVENETNPYVAMISDSEATKVKLLGDKSIIDGEKTQKLVVLKHLEYIKDAYHNKRKIKAWWISKLIPFLNTRIKYYLNHFESLDTVEFDEFLSVKMSRWPYATHSGGEKRSIDLSVMFGLRDLHTSVFGQQSNFMVLDEVEGRLDKFLVNKFVSVIRDDILMRKDGLTNVLVISHKAEMYDKFPNKIRVKNKGGNAYIVNE